MEHDKTKSGKLYRDQVKSIWTSIDNTDNVTDESIEAIMDILDREKKGYITFNDFVSGMGLINNSNFPTSTHYVYEPKTVYPIEEDDPEEEDDLDLVKEKYRSMKSDNETLSMKITTLEKQLNISEINLEDQLKRVNEQQDIINEHKSLLRKQVSMEGENYHLTEEAERLKEKIQQLEGSVTSLQKTKKQLIDEKKKFKRISI